MSSFLSGLSCPLTPPRGFRQVAATTSGTPNAITALSASSVPVSRAILLARTTNAAAILVGPDSSTQPVSLGPGTAWEINPGDGADDLSRWHFKSASASQVLDIIYYPN